MAALNITSPFTEVKIVKMYAGKSILLMATSEAFAATVRIVCFILARISKSGGKLGRDFVELCEREDKMAEAKDMCRVLLSSLASSSFWAVERVLLTE